MNETSIDVTGEFDRAELGDARLTRRVGMILERMSAAPAASFPKIAPSHAALEGIYRFLQHDNVSFEALLAAHAAATCERIAARDERLVLVAHDTSEFFFEGEIYREGLGWLSNTKQGFYGHFALALSADGTRRPYGVLGLSITMPPRPAAKRAAKRRKKNGAACATSDNRAVNRWGNPVEQTTALLRGYAIPIHIMDREADGFELLAFMVDKQQRFVVRVRATDRHVKTGADGYTAVSNLRVVLDEGVVVAEREVPLSRRRASHLRDANKKHPPRQKRIARLTFRAERVRFQRPKNVARSVGEELVVNVVYVREQDTPVGMEPVDWMLVTTEPIDSAEDVLRIVDYYRARWLIEEFFQAIKTGCAFQKRQLETAPALLNALAISLPIACNLLLLRDQSRRVPDAPAESVLSTSQLRILRAIAKKAPLPASPTATDVLFAVAGLGGHIKYNGPPGWRTLGAGMEKLLFAEYVVECTRSGADKAQTCDE